MNTAAMFGNEHQPLIYLWFTLQIRTRHHWPYY